MRSSYLKTEVTYGSTSPLFYPPVWVETVLLGLKSLLSSSDRHKCLIARLLEPCRSNYLRLLFHAAADVFLWKDRNTSVAVLVGSTLLWCLLEKSGYTLLTLLSNIFMFSLAILFVWANVSSLLNRWVSSFNQ